MKFQQSLVLFIALLANCLAAPLDLTKAEQDVSPELKNQGQMLYNREARNVIINTAKRWPNNIICYRFNTAFTTAQKNYVRDAMDYIEGLTFVRFVADTKGRSDCVSINPVPAGSGCSSNIGYLGVPQVLNIPNIAVGTGCFTKFRIVHELLHTCGMFHQHMAHDRDNYVDIIWANIIPGREDAFAKKSATETTSFGLPYDYESIMHYGPNVSSSNGLATIVPKINVSIGQRTQMSPIDVLKMWAMYPLLKSPTPGQTNSSTTEN